MGENVEAVAHKLVLVARSLLDVTADAKQAAATADVTRLDRLLDHERLRHVTRRTKAEVELRGIQEQIQLLTAW